MSITSLAPVPPWGSSRLAPYATIVQVPHASVTVDPVTQLGVFRDRNGQVVEMGQHGTSSATGTTTQTSPDGGPGTSDQGSDQDDQQD
ncbi:putative ATP-grasp-modified RiPP [Streptomyces sp. NBC_00249]|uniref:putative ATP-grasp-modified RiPP n=1 Tax=Streptomyces sp. NBC_00249 TaxID=2975690 RepID=UPI0022539E42|nr:putative ATP-grasp-modified RiPP [Streptomyces sp. NBC_00249]MCX5194437.1 putative ATP-grasp-modified RiPP [Streptomyces sp. NBC_00249]